VFPPGRVSRKDPPGRIPETRGRRVQTGTSRGRRVQRLPGADPGEVEPTRRGRTAYRSPALSESQARTDAVWCWVAGVQLLHECLAGLAKSDRTGRGSREFHKAGHRRGHGIVTGSRNPQLDEFRDDQVHRVATTVSTAERYATRREEGPGRGFEHGHDPGERRPTCRPVPQWTTLPSTGSSVT